MTSRVTWRPCGDAAALAEVEDLATVLRLHAALVHERAHGRLPGVVDLVPAARALLLRCDDATALERVVSRVGDLELPEAVPHEEGEEVTVPVTYDGEDLDVVAELLRVDREEVVRRHTGTAWRVAFTGFAPGFGYLVAADGSSTLEVPRRPEPRTQVPSGAVGLAGEFTGVYPRSSPGGWQLIGRTELAVWDVGREPPAVLGPGTRVRFVSTS